jgi:hypothetical protein
MAWTGTDIGQFDPFLKEWYMSKWVDLLNNITTTYRLFRRRIQSFKGRRMIIALRTRRTGAVGAIPVSGYAASGVATSAGAQNLKSPGYQGTANAIVRPKIVMGAIGMPQDVIDISGTDQAAFYEVVDFEMMGLKVDMGQYLDVLKYAGGAPLADITTGSVSGTPPDTFKVTMPRRFYPGQSIDFWTTWTTGATLRGTGTVAGVSGRTITLDTGISGLVDTDYPYYSGARSANICYEPLGFEEIIKELGASPTATAGDLLLQDYESTTDIYGIDRTVAAGESGFASTIIDKSGAEVEFEDLHRLCDEVHDSSGGDPTVFLTNRTTRRLIAKKMAYVAPTVYGTPSNTAYANVATQRFINTTKLKGGFIGRREDMHGEGGNDWVLFDDRIPIVVDRMATYLDDDTAANRRGTIFAIDSRHYFDGQVTDWKWWAPEGRILREAGGLGATAGNMLFGVVAHAYQFYESVVDAPNTCGRIHGIDVSGVF